MDGGVAGDGPHLGGGGKSQQVGDLLAGEGGEGAVLLGAVTVCM